MRRIDRPEPGLYQIRLKRGEAKVPAAIGPRCPVMLTCNLRYYAPSEWCQHSDRARTPNLIASILGYEVEMDRVWMYGEPITESRYRYLMDLATWKRLYGHTEEPAPEPEAKPERVDVSKQPSVF